jgi:hypothetical protein
MSLPRGKVLGQLLDGEFSEDMLPEHPGLGLVDHLASFWPQMRERVKHVAGFVVFDSDHGCFIISI